MFIEFCKTFIPHVDDTNDNNSHKLKFIHSMYNPFEVIIDEWEELEVRGPSAHFICIIFY